VFIYFLFSYFFPFFLKKKKERKKERKKIPDGPSWHTTGHQDPTPLFELFTTGGFLGVAALPQKEDLSQAKSN
jgi:hypothetical protein